MSRPCDFCCEPKDADAVEGTAFVGSYCIECHRINIEESREAIRTIRERMRKHRKGRRRKP